MGKFFRTSGEVAFFCLFHYKEVEVRELVYFCEGGGVGVADTNI